MTGPQQGQQHDEPFGETRAQLLQALAVAATVGEAAARWAAVGVQNRASKAEKDQQAQHAAARARQESERLAEAARREQDRADRAHIGLAFDDAWLADADLYETARLWRVATMHAASGDDRAREAMGRAETRLGQLRPNLMVFYQQFRAEGHLPEEAMRAASYGVWLQADNSTLGRQHAREHAGRQAAEVRAGANGRSLGPGGPVLDDLDAAVRREVVDLARGVDPEMLDQLQRQWRSKGLVPAGDAAKLLARHARDLLHEAAVGGPEAGTTTIRRGVARPGVDEHGQIVYNTQDMPVRAGDAGLQIVGQYTDGLAEKARADAAAADHLAGFVGQQQGQGTRDYGAPDVAATPVDEHDAGLAAGRVEYGQAEHDSAGADQRRRMAQSFTQLTHVQATHPDLATKQEAQTSPTQQRGRRR
jgi:hypothetical protein